MFSAFMANTWLVVTIVAVIAGAVGFFVVLRQSAFAAHALPVAAFPGAAAASLLGVNTLIGLIVFAGLGALGIARLRPDGRREVATALTLVSMLGLGALLLSRTTEYSSEVYALLFGQVLGVSAGDIAPIAILGLLAAAATAALYRPLLLSSVSPELAAARGVSERRLELAFLMLLALATVMTLPVVGALLVFSLMVGPPAAARAFTARPLQALLLSVAIALPTAWGAVALSYLSNWPVGFFVGMLSAAAFAAGRAWAARHARAWPAAAPR